MKQTTEMKEKPSKERKEKKAQVRPWWKARQDGHAQLGSVPVHLY